MNQLPHALRNQTPPKRSSVMHMSCPLDLDPNGSECTCMESILVRLRIHDTSRRTCYIFYPNSSKMAQLTVSSRTHSFFENVWWADADMQQLNNVCSVLSRWQDSATKESSAALWKATTTSHSRGLIHKSLDKHLSKNHFLFCFFIHSKAPNNENFPTAQTVCSFQPNNSSALGLVHTQPLDNKKRWQEFPSQEQRGLSRQCWSENRLTNYSNNNPLFHNQDCSMNQ